MNKPLNEALSIETAQRVKSKAKTPFENAYRGTLATQGAIYAQGFLAFAGKPYKPIEHGWMELEDCIVDPTLPYLNQNAQEIWYFTAQRLTVKQLKAIIEESKEDYPEDDPLPVYGEPPYQYYGNIMLGGQDYLEAYQAAEAKCRELSQHRSEKPIQN
ncbi:hypothetical protein [Brasilonema sp. UFV-L1]|uniref:hypothetical protein n=1 Tax=Brasilonema sp. UFV-L1 TaxID=2234130 RepID=UPI00145E5214|nr:hypothetical protein [Brasilonema sp. UFV-L1]NMG11161.1 hypothetical protein [Brasilonema sp. UFV-L1]